MASIYKSLYISIDIVLQFSFASELYSFCLLLLSKVLLREIDLRVEKTSRISGRSIGSSPQHPSKLLYPIGVPSIIFSLSPPCIANIRAIS
ncbi:6833_t:CDS:2 [Funneliformis mosseae]|uniref:6833_t:CDS:1 n=1 Tax=Funneliformis mosseae TaxID=27381 RepID=A0A9N9F5K6_FUNMO|nr:6833_t:CDS:2 [Funneliformis mosseae]